MSDKSRRMRWTGMWKVWGRRNVYKGLVLKPDGKTPFGRPSSRWGGNITMDLQEVRCGVMG